MAEPDTPPKNSEASTLICARPPRALPTSAAAKAISRSEMPPRIISSPAKTNSGIAISEVELAPAAVCSTTTPLGSPRYSTVSSEDVISENATGTPSSSSAKKAMNRIVTATVSCPPPACPARAAAGPPRTAR